MQPGSKFTARFLKGGAVFEKKFSRYDYQYCSSCIPDFSGSTGSADPGSIQRIPDGITDYLLSYDSLSADQQRSETEI